MAVKKSTKVKLVLVGCKNLSADIVKVGDPIVYGEVVEIEGDALLYAQGKKYHDSLGNIHDMFVSPDSAEGKRALGIEDDEEPQTRTRRRR